MPQTKEEVQKLSEVGIVPIHSKKNLAHCRGNGKEILSCGWMKN